MPSEHTATTGTTGHPPSTVWRTFCIASAAVFLVLLDTTAVIAAYAPLRAYFSGVSVADLSWTLNAYTVLFAALLVPAGRLADLLGRKRIFLHGLALFCMASALCAWAPGITTLIAARALQAVGAALLTPASLALVLGAFPREKRAAAVGMFSAVGALAAAVGPAFGSWVIEVSSWRWVFLINVPLGVSAWALARRHLQESTSPETGGRPDWLGIALLTLGAGAVAWGIVRTESPGWTQPLAAMAAGLALLIVFAFWAKGRPSAALDLTLFEDRSFLFVNLATAVFGVAFTAMFLSSFLFLMGIWGYSQGLAGWAVTPGPVVVIPVAIAAGRLAGRIGHRPLLVVGGVLYAVAQAWLSLRIGSTPRYLATWLPGQVLGGVAVGLVLPSLSGAAVAKLGPTRLGVGGGVNNAVRQMGGAAGAALAVALVGRSGAGLTQFQSLYAVLAGLGLLTALLCLPVQTRLSSAVAARAGAAS
jgi:EmrB/QacA subfamily drug resistance transporter